MPHVPKTWRSYSFDMCRHLLGFTPEVMAELFNLLQIPAVFITKSRHRFTGEEAFTFFLRRLKSVQTLECFKDEFNRQTSDLCECFNGMATWIDAEWCHLIDGGVQDMSRWSSQLQTWYVYPFLNFEDHHELWRRIPVTVTPYSQYLSHCNPCT